MANFVHVHCICLYCYILSFDNVMVVYNCNCLHVSIIRVITLPSFVALHLPVSELANCMGGVYITRTILLTTMFTVIILCVH